MEDVGMVMVSFSWSGFDGGGNGTGDFSSGGGWGAFTPNVGGFDSGGWGGNWGTSFDSFGSYSGGWNTDLGDVAIGGGGGGNWGAFTPQDDGFTNSEPLGGYAGTNPTYDSITEGERVVVTAKHPNTDPYNPVTVPYDPTVPWLDTVTVVENYDWRSVEQPRDPNATTLETVTVKPPETNELTDQQWRDWWADEQAKVFMPFTGGIGSMYEGFKSWMKGDWWGVGLAAIGVLPLGRFTRVGQLVRTPVGEGMGFTSHSSMVRYLGKAGENKQWHHIVEQNPANIGQFGSRQVHNTQNIIALDTSIHQEINRIYSSSIAGPGSPRVRDWLSTKSYDYQYQYGMDVLRKLGVNL